MQKIYLVFNNKGKEDAWSSIYNNLKSIFNNYIDVSICFLDELSRNNEMSIRDGDLYLVLYQDRIYSLKKYVTSLDKVVVLNRTIQKRYLKDILEIPSGKNVLIVNDSYMSTVQTATVLYQIGINHINLIPFVNNNEDLEQYKDIEYAITPNEGSYVPFFVKNIINIEERYIDSITFINIIKKLKLNNEHITRNFLMYIKDIVSSELSESNAYLTDHMKNEMLKNAFDSSNEAIILIDYEYSFIYANNKSYKTFTIDEDMSFEIFFETTLKKIFINVNTEDEFFNYENINYSVYKNVVKVLDQIVGYSFTIQSEHDINNLEQGLKKQLVRTGLIAKYNFDDIIYKSNSMNYVIKKAKKIALSDYPALILGESGTGKELIAQSMHNFSNRKKHPFVAINCAALPETLLESELFGYEKGAFTGANKSGKVGLIEQANGGTLFLDEIGDMSIRLQARILRVLQEMQIMRLSSNKVINVDVRIISATNKNLKEAVIDGKFREDLYYRLCVLPIVIPSLRKRPEDPLLLFETFLTDNNDYKKISEKDKNIINSYSWPGNIRELISSVIYYKMFDVLPSSCFNEHRENDNLFDDNQNANLYANDIDNKVLRIIADNTTETHGIGRSMLVYKLKEININISDSYARTLLEKLEADGLILISKGRSGNKITQKGMELLLMKKEQFGYI